jgi:hypothetical protein
MVGWRTIPARVASGPEDLLSRLIDMRLPGNCLVTRWGLFLRRGALLHHVVNVLAAAPSLFLIHTLRLRWKSFSRVLSTNQRQRQSSHDEDIQLESSTETGKPRRCRLFVYTVSENFDIDLICYELEPRPP